MLTISLKKNAVNNTEDPWYVKYFGLCKTLHCLSKRRVLPNYHSNYRLFFTYASRTLDTEIWLSTIQTRNYMVDQISNGGWKIPILLLKCQPHLPVVQPATLTSSGIRKSFYKTNGIRSGAAIVERTIFWKW